MQFATKSLGLLTLYLSTVLGACGRPPRSALPLGRDPRPYSERVAADRAALSRWIEHVRGADADARPRAAVAELLRGLSPEKTWVTLDGWALRRAELAGADAWVGQVGTSRTNVAIDVLRHYVEELRERGIELLVVPVPARLQLYADRLPGCDESPSGAAFDLAFIEALHAVSSAGIEVLPLIANFADARFAPGHPGGERLFLDYNTHWTPRGASLAADLIAERVRQMEAYEPGPFRQGEDFDVRLQRVAFQEPSPLEEARDPRELVMECVVDGTGQPVDARDHRSAIVLLGDSFAGFYGDEGADLTRLLFARLGWRLDLIGLSGSEGTNWNALARRSNPLADKRLVLWVFNAGALGGSRFRKVGLHGD